MIATATAKRMMKERGHVVLAFVWDAMVPTETANFANASLDSGYVLRIGEKTNAKDWKDQMIAVNGNLSVNKSANYGKIAGAKYFKANLLKTANAKRVSRKRTPEAK